MGSSSPAQPTVLVVDDEAFLRIFLTDLLADEGCTVLEAGDADQAVALLEEYPEISVVVTDIQMPGSMDGVRLSHYIRDRWPPMRLIVMSGKSQLDVSTLPRNATFLSKPFDPDRLVQLVDCH